LKHRTRDPFAIELSGLQPLSRVYVWMGREGGGEGERREGERGEGGRHIVVTWDIHTNRN